MKPDKKIEEILDRYIGNENFDMVWEKELTQENLVKELNTEVQKAVEDGVKGFVLGIMRKYVLNISLNDLEDETIEYLQSLDKGDTDGE